MRRAATLLAFVLLSTSFAAAAQTRLGVTTVAEGLSSPWGLAFLPDGRMLVTERPGRLRIVERDGRVGATVAGVPKVDARGQGGLLDVALDPAFATNGRVYLSFSEPGDGGNATAVARGRLDGSRLEDVRVIFRQNDRYAGTNHFGSRLVFDRDGHLFVTLGDRYARRDDAQRLSSHLGKVVRIDTDGRAPADNPFLKTANARPEIWSLGHRNVQGAALHPVTGELWTHEHGPQGGDEVNVTLPGRNYGWPVVTRGVEYGSGKAIGEGARKDGMEDAVTTWVPSVAPSGMAFLTSDRYPGWKGNLFVGTLREQKLVRLELDGRRVVREERLLGDLRERLRDVRQGPDGWLYALTDSPDGRLLRLTPR